MIKGITFDEQSMSSANMAHFAYSFMSNESGVTKGCAVTANGNNVTVAAGYFFVHGRQVQNIGNTTISAPSVQGSTYATLVFTVDLNQQNTSDAFNQGYFEILTNTSTYPTLTQEDLDAGGKVYQMPFANMIITSSGISNLVQTFAAFSNKFDRLTRVTEVSLPASGWSGKSQTKTVAGMSADSYPNFYIKGNPTEAQYEAFTLITSMETAANSVTFRCAGDVPTTDMVVMIKGL